MRSTASELDNYSRDQPIVQGGDAGNQARQEFSLPPADSGRDAWLFLCGCWAVEALVWGVSSSRSAESTYQTDVFVVLIRFRFLVWCLPRLLFLSFTFQGIRQHCRGRDHDPGELLPWAWPAPI